MARALVLSGGGSRGAYQAGAWKALHDTGWRPDLVIGTSVGALNGAMIASHMHSDDIIAWWRRLRQKDLLRPRRDVWRLPAWSSLYDPGPLRGLLEQELDVDALDAGTPLRITATCLETGQEVVWATPALRVDHFMATTALLPGLPPVSIDGRHYADGGHWTALPLRHALEAGCDEVHVLLHDPIAPHDEPAPQRPREVMRRQSDIIWHGRQAAEWEALQARMALPRRHPMHLPQARITFHAPEPPLDNQILRFRPREIKDMLSRGEEETARRLAQDA